MRITITKGTKDDRLEIQRDDGSCIATHFPKKGPIPHDYVHFAIEQGLGLDDAFWGKVAAGADPEMLGDLAKMGGHASAKRAGVPDSNIVEMVQSERLVECFEADLWSGGGDCESLRALAEAGWAASKVPPLVLADDQIVAIRKSIADFAERWSVCAIGESIAIEWGAAA